VSEVICFIIWFSFGLFAGIDWATEVHQQVAVDRGHAEWRIIPGTSKTEFKWKDDQ
jgi:hypothetical protein